MSFITDKQTIDDLNIFSKSGSDSIYHIFNKTFTQGGAALLEEMFRSPLSDHQAINERVAILRYFQESKTDFPLQGNRFEETERYLSNTDPRSLLFNQSFSMADFNAAGQSVTALMEILQGLKKFMLDIEPKVNDNPYGKQVTAVLALLNAKELELIFKDHGKGKISSGKIVEYDNISSSVTCWRRSCSRSTTWTYVFPSPGWLPNAAIFLQRPYSVMRTAFG